MQPQQQEEEQEAPIDSIRTFERLVRPLLTVLITGVYNVAMMWGMVSGSMSGAEYAQAVGPANMLILGFWFGERAAVKSLNTPPPAPPPSRRGGPPRPLDETDPPAAPAAPVQPTTSLF